MKKFVLAVCVAAASVFSTGAQAQTAGLTQQDVQRIVGEYIEKNGELLADTLDKYYTRKQLADAAKRISAHTPTLGPENAKVTFIEFSDFDCPFCARVQDTLAELQRRYKTRVKFAFKHLPLEGIHPKAVDAAKAAQAAHRQGKFWPFANALFERQEFTGEQLWKDVAKELKLDMDKFNKDRTSAEVEAEVMADLQDAQDVGARGTPFFLINGQALSGAQPLEVFVAIIEDQLKKADDLAK